MKEEKIKQEGNINQERLINLYMDYVLENGEEPRSIYKFTREHGITQGEFYNFFGSFEGLKSGIWESFFSNTIEVMQVSKEYQTF